ncbi:hypothetical protein AMECASPLE_019089 [Ameca splendens]|uniref:Uncharacterized protein n=1 Tax=Ameca splendens TaxID=208324 RepID=A0ABV0XRW9_9TELE
MIMLSEYLRRVAEKSACRDEEVEEQRSPFWGSRLAIPLPGTGPRCYTLSPSSQCKPPARHRGHWHTAFSSPSESVSGTAHFLCPVQHSSMLPPQAFCSPFDSELLFPLSSAVDAVAVRTLFPLLWRFGQAPPFPCPVSSPTSFPFPTLPQ